MAKGKKTGGIQKGGFHKKTREAQTMLKAEFDSQEFYVPFEIVQAFRVNDLERVDRLMRLLEYLFPKIHAKMTVDGEMTEDLGLTVNLSQIIK